MATSITLDRAAGSKFAAGFGGDLIGREDGRYEEAR
jgi:hypothetical protein